MRPHEQIRKIYKPYENFDIFKYPFNFYGWGFPKNLYFDLLKWVQPKEIIEVGSWVGASAVIMAEIAQQLNFDCKILCVDTWLGSSEFLADCTATQELRLKDGYPQIYTQFVANIIHKGLQEVVTPLPTTSALAARFFSRLDYTADAIHLNQTRDLDDLESDLKNYWPLTRNVMFGMGYRMPSVALAVHNFVQKNKLEIRSSYDFWSISR